MSAKPSAAPALRLLGPVRVGDAPVGVRREAAVLVLAAAESRPVSRQRLAAWLWPDSPEEEAASRLRRLLHSINSKAVANPAAKTAAHGAPLLDVTRQDVALTAAARAASDLAELRQCLAAGLYRGDASTREALAGQRADAAQERLALQRAVDLAAGELAEGLVIDECNEFTHWLMRLRESLRQAAEQAAARLAALQVAGSAASPVRFARNGDVFLAYRELGAPARSNVDVLFISGFVSHLELGAEPGGPREFFATVARSARVIQYDRRGVGLSDRTVDPAATSDSVADALAVLDAAGSRRVVVFAVSEGGPIAIRLAVEHPQRVAGLVLFGTLARGLAAPDYPHALAAAQFETWLARLTANWGGPAGIEVFAGARAKDPVLRDWWARTLRSGSTPRCVQSVLRTLAQTDVRELLARVCVPTTVLHRTGDRAVRVDAGRYVAHGIPNARLVELAGDEHWWWLGDAQPIVDAIESHLRTAA